MTRRRSLGISVAAAALALIVVYGIYFLLIRQVELQKTVQVVVPKSFIGAGTYLTGELLEYRSISLGALRPGMITVLNEAVGKSTFVPLGGHEPLLDWKLDRFRLLPPPGRATFSIPKDFVLSIPGGVRAGDLVTLYASGIKGTYRLFQDKIMVASIKSSANLEVDDPKQSHLLALAQNDKDRMYLSRRDANGTVEQLNLNLTEEEWESIHSVCREEGSKLVIALHASAYVEGREEGQ